jgi:carboxymethylenebutenolidase
MFAAKSKEIAAVASFYGNLRKPPFANRKKDLLDVVGQITVPVQGHYSENDPEIPLDQLRGFEQSLKRQRTHAEIYTYKSPHGFFAYTRPTYDKQAAEISWRRTVGFFNKVLGH